MIRKLLLFHHCFIILTSYLISNFKNIRTLFNFNEHFSKKCSLIQNRSAITSAFKPLNHKSLSSFQFTVNDIKNIINKLDTNQAHGHMISICMIKLCGDSIYKTSEMIFKSCLDQWIFSVEWKKANVVPVYKMEDHQYVKNYKYIF